MPKIIFGVFIAALVSISHADQVRLLALDHEALQARLDVVQQAKEEILVEYFSVWNDEVSVAGLALMVDAARRGVKVKIIMDALSNKVPAAMVSAVERLGRNQEGRPNLEIRFYNPLNPLLPLNLMRRTHAKLIIVDGKRVITGGRNVGDKYFGFSDKHNYHDLDVLVDGVSVAPVRENFMQLWSSVRVSPQVTEHLSDSSWDTPCFDLEDECARAKATARAMVDRQSQRLEAVMAAVIEGKYKVKANTGTNWLAGARDYEVKAILPQITEGLVVPDESKIGAELIEIANQATDEIRILSPYLIPTGKLYALVEALINRGVKLKVITNSIASTDNVFAQAGYRIAKDRLIQMGIELYEYNGPHTAHAKAAVVHRKSDKVVIVGTFNLDPRSANLNREVALAISDSSQDGIASEVEDQMDRFQADSLLVGKDGAPQNVELQRQRTSFWKNLVVSAITVLLPIIYHQL